MKTTFRIGLALVLAGSIVWQANESLADDPTSGTHKIRRTITTHNKTITETPENEGGDAVRPSRPAARATPRAPARQNQRRANATFDGE